MSGDVAHVWRANKVREWLLAILRFAVTLDQADRAAVLATATEMDRSIDFSFFLRTSTELCDAIVHKDDPKRAAALHRHLKRIDDQRLRRTFEAAVELHAAPVPAKAPPRPRRGLWDGLASTGKHSGKSAASR